VNLKEGKCEILGLHLKINTAYTGNDARVGTGATKICIEPGTAMNLWILRIKCHTN